MSHHNKLSRHWLHGTFIFYHSTERYGRTLSEPFILASFLKNQMKNVCWSQAQIFPKVRLRDPKLLTRTRTHTHTHAHCHMQTHTHTQTLTISLTLSLPLWRKRLSLSCLDIWFIFTLQTKFLFYLNLQMTAAAAAAAEFKKLIREQESFSFFASEENKIWFLWKNISSASFHRQAHKIKQMLWL